MTKYIAPEDMTIQQIKAAISAEFANWNKYYVQGGNDPFYTDGYNLNLIRNHIIHWGTWLAKKQQVEFQISLFDTEEPSIVLPPIIDDGYMANADIIRVNAQSTLDAIENNDDYLYILSAKNLLSEQQKKRCYLNQILAYPRYLQNYLEEDDLVRLRTYQNTEYWLKVYASLAKQVINMIFECEKISNAS